MMIFKFLFRTASSDDNRNYPVKPHDNVGSYRGRSRETSTYNRTQSWDRSNPRAKRGHERCKRNQIRYSNKNERDLKRPPRKNEIDCKRSSKKNEIDRKRSMSKNENGLKRSTSRNEKDLKRSTSRNENDLKRSTSKNENDLKRSTSKNENDLKRSTSRNEKDRESFSGRNKNYLKRSSSNNERKHKSPSTRKERTRIRKSCETLRNIRITNTRDERDHRSASNRDEINHISTSTREEGIPRSASIRDERSHRISPTRDVRSHRSSPTRDERSHRIAPTRDVRSHRSSPTRDVRSHRSSPARDERSHRSSPTRDERSHRSSPTRDVRSHRSSPTRDERTHRSSPTRDERSLRSSPTRDERTHRSSPTRDERSHRSSPARDERTHRSSPTRDERSLRSSPTRDERSHRSSPTRDVRTHRRSPTRDERTHRSSPTRDERTHRSSPDDRDRSSLDDRDRSSPDDRDRSLQKRFQSETNLNSLTVNERPRDDHVSPHEIECSDRRLSFNDPKHPECRDHDRIPNRDLNYESRSYEKRAYRESRTFDESYSKDFMNDQKCRRRDSNHGKYKHRTSCHDINHKENRSDRKRSRTSSHRDKINRDKSIPRNLNYKSRSPWDQMSPQDEETNAQNQNKRQREPSQSENIRKRRDSSQLHNDCKPRRILTVFESNNIDTEELDVNNISQDRDENKEESEDAITREQAEGRKDFHIDEYKGTSNLIKQIMAQSDSDDSDDSDESDESENKSSLTTVTQKDYEYVMVPSNNPSHTMKSLFIVKDKTTSKIETLNSNLSNYTIPKLKNLKLSNHSKRISREETKDEELDRTRYKKVLETTGKCPRINDTPCKNQTKDQDKLRERVKRRDPRLKTKKEEPSFKRMRINGSPLRKDYTDNEFMKPNISRKNKFTKESSGTVGEIGRKISTVEIVKCLSKTEESSSVEVARSENLEGFCSDEIFSNEYDLLGLSSENQAPVVGFEARENETVATTSKKASITLNMKNKRSDEVKVIGSGLELGGNGSPNNPDKNVVSTLSSEYSEYSDPFTQLKQEVKQENDHEYVEDEHDAKPSIAIKKEESPDIFENIVENIKNLNAVSLEEEAGTESEIPPINPNSGLFKTPLKKKKSSLSGPSSVLLSLYHQFQVLKGVSIKI